jgi:hypothetical protein
VSIQRAYWHLPQHRRLVVEVSEYKMDRVKVAVWCGVVGFNLAFWAVAGVVAWRWTH